MEFKSPSTNINVTAAQYLAELVVARQIKRKGLDVNPFFWRNKFWGKQFQLQIIAANGLLKIFDIKDVLSALNEKDSRWISTLKYKALPDSILRHQQLREKLEKHTSIKLEVVEEIKIQQPQKVSSLGAKLSNL